MVGPIVIILPDQLGVGGGGYAGCVGATGPQSNMAMGKDGVVGGRVGIGWGAGGGGGAGQDETGSSGGDGANGVVGILFL